MKKIIVYFIFMLLIYNTVADEPNGDWETQNITLYNTSEADIMCRIGDIDNLGFGWPNGFDPFSGNSTPVHPYPYSPELLDATGTDEIYRPSSHGSFPQPCGNDGYLSSGVNPQPLTLTYDLQETTVVAITIQMFVDDFQAAMWCANWNATIDGVSAPFLTSIINSLMQTGPIGKLITVQVPAGYIQYFADGSVQIKIDDTTTGAGDGYAIDFAKILINATGFSYTGTIQGTITDSDGGAPLENALITASSISDYTIGSGFYQLTDVPAGQILIEVCKTDYISQSQIVDLVNGEIATHNFSLVENPVAVEVAFTDGSAYSPSASQGQSNRTYGRFQLSGVSEGALLSGISMQLDGERTGIENFKIWQSIDDTFDNGIDSQLGLTIAEDPGDGNSVNFTGLTSSIPINESYFFMTYDISRATGSICGVILSEENITLENGKFTSSFNNATLSESDNPLPITLSSFVVIQTVSNFSQLSWTTQSEINLSGYNVYRSTENNSETTIKINSQLIQGTNSSDEQHYSFTDETVVTETEYFYWLESIEISGNTELFGPISVIIENQPDNPIPPSTIITGLHQNYPNPFNPKTEIKFAIEKSGNAELTIYNIKGQEVITLFSGYANANEYIKVRWNGNDHQQNAVSSGVFMYKLKTDNSTYLKKMILLK
ncbi:MAG: T9SS type A sorting domain-containing protein [Candidatus Cloacimonetes bacterium]|nr:T9SS type A sorting domain-containing protein [Candidatus Cloacimonadota bacterium]